jgi:hypothetical protein
MSRCFPSRENLPNFPLCYWFNSTLLDGIIETFPVIRRLPGNVAKTPCVAQFAATCVCSQFLKVKSDNFPTSQSSKSIIQEAPCELEHTHIHTETRAHTHTHTYTHAERHS